MTIYKAMGYGLRGLEISNGKIVDHRINTSSILLDYDREDEATVREYVRSTLSGKENALSLDQVLAGHYWSHIDPESTDPFEAVQHLYETKFDDTLILRPVGDRDWTRRGDLLDSYTAVAGGNSGIDTITNLRGGIHPYSNHYMDTTTNERVDWYAIGDWIRAVNSDDQRYAELYAGEASLKLGWDELTNEEMKKRVVPMPPPEIIKLAEFGKLFTEPEYVYDLRPMIATVWR